MAAFSIVIRGKRRDGYYPVYIMVNHKSTPGYIKTTFVVSDKGLKKTYTKTGREKIEVSDKLVTRECMNEIAGYVRRLNDINSRNMTVNEVISYLTNEYKELSFTVFAGEYISGMINHNRENTALNYRMAVKRFHEYMNRDSIFFLTSSHSFP
jgi:hypothetical protein